MPAQPLNAARPTPSADAPSANAARCPMPDARRPVLDFDGPASRARREEAGDFEVEISFRKLSFNLGVEVVGADLMRPIGDAAFTTIRRAFVEHGVLLFRDARIDRDHHLAFSRRFGELDRHDSVPRDRDPALPEILLVTNRPSSDGTVPPSAYTGHLWHSDMSFTLAPAMGSLLRAVTVPPVGGDTMFANMAAAYDALTPAMQRMLEPLHAVHSPERKNAERSPQWEAENRRINPPVAQPVVRVHEESGRRALYVGQKVRRFDGMSEAESRPLLDFLIAHATQPRFVYRHVWRQDDLLLWDNRSTMHIALGDYDPRALRHMERTTVLGAPSGRVATDAAA
jgi:taurine dioxygenase